jgi:hypothetical protein
MWQRFKLWWSQYVQEWWRKYQWYVIIALGVVGLVLGVIGFAKHALTYSQPRTFLDNFYLTIQLITLESGSISGSLSWELEIARFLLPALAAYAAFTAFVLVFNEQLRSVKLRTLQDHVIICGLGRKGVLLVEQFRERGENVVAIEPDEGNDWIDVCRDSGAIVLVGDSTDPDWLRKARVDRAKLLIATMGDDGVNAEVAVQAQALSHNRKRGVLTCIIHIVDPNLMTLLKEKELDMESGLPFRWQLFNIFHRGANLLLQDFPAWRVDENGDIHPKHVLVVGTGEMGEQLIVRIAQEWWSRNRVTNQQIPIVMIDREAEWKAESLNVRYPHLKEVCQIESLQMDIRSVEFQQCEFLRDRKNPGSIDQVYICLDDDSLGLHAGLLLNKHLRTNQVPIVIRMVEDAGLATLLRGDGRDKGVYKNLHAFGLLDRTCTADLLLGGSHEILARSLHEEYLRTHLDQGETKETNPVLVPWEQLPEKVKEANRLQVDRIYSNLQAIGYWIAPLTDWDAASIQFMPEEIAELAREEHEAWAEQLLREGWSYAHGVKDPNRKTHPDLVSWDELPESEKEYTRNEMGRLPDFLFRAGFQIDTGEQRVVDDTD